MKAISLEKFKGMFECVPQHTQIRLDVFLATKEEGFTLSHGDNILMTWRRDIRVFKKLDALYAFVQRTFNRQIELTVHMRYDMRKLKVGYRTDCMPREPLQYGQWMPKIQESFGIDD